MRASSSFIHQTSNKESLHVWSASIRDPLLDAPFAFVTDPLCEYLKWTITYLCKTKTFYSFSYYFTPAVNLKKPLFHC